MRFELILALGPPLMVLVRITESSPVLCIMLNSKLCVTPRLRLLPPPPSSKFRVPWEYKFFMRLLPDSLWLSNIADIARSFESLRWSPSCEYWSLAKILLLKLLEVTGWIPTIVNSVNLLFDSLSLIYLNVDGDLEAAPPIYWLCYGDKRLLPLLLFVGTLSSLSLVLMWG
jgi:hypothetical protein